MNKFINETEYFQFLNETTLSLFSGSFSQFLGWTCLALTIFFFVFKKFKLGLIFLLLSTLISYGFAFSEGLSGLKGLIPFLFNR